MSDEFTIVFDLWFTYNKTCILDDSPGQMCKIPSFYGHKRNYRSKRVSGSIFGTSKVNISNFLELFNSDTDSEIEHNVQQSSTIRWDS